MLAWLQAALPDCKVTNLSSDWSSGLLLSALVDYCEPGIFFVYFTEISVLL
jgi:filamin